MNFGNIVIMMSKFGSKSGDFAQRGAHFLSPNFDSQGNFFYHMIYFREAPPSPNISNLNKIVNYYLIKNKIQ